MTVVREVNLPSVAVYHFIFVVRDFDSWISVRTNAVSPPGA